MAKTAHFQLRPQAVQDLDNIYHYSMREFGIERAEQYIRDLDNSFHH